mmetsp:Transcript_23256/g.52452  ORF Transcript_23256/g.52452 Transcript_23256/m.52452 type:complete len:220 (-) Transcript_23256:971-1630(-)
MSRRRSCSSVCSFSKRACSSAKRSSSARVSSSRRCSSAFAAASSAQTSSETPASRPASPLSAPSPMGASTTSASTSASTSPWVSVSACRSVVGGVGGRSAGVAIKELNASAAVVGREVEGGRCERLLIFSLIADWTSNARRDFLAPMGSRTARVERSRRAASQTALTSRALPQPRSFTSSEKPPMSASSAAGSTSKPFCSARCRKRAMQSLGRQSGNSR